MPYEEKGELSPFAGACGVPLISLIAPSSDARIGRIARDAEGLSMSYPASASRACAAK
jgi:tryptophan synthase alpha chain